MGTRSSLGKKFNILLIGVFVVGTLLTWMLAAWITRRQTEQEIAEKAELLLKATAGVRTYTVSDVGKLLLPVQRDQKTFLPETVPAFSARSVFENFRQDGFEDFFYKEAASNPTNVKDNKADAFEEGVLGALRKDDKLKTLSGYREDFGGQRRYFTAVAMRLTDGNCLRCHSTPDQAPTEMVKLYGDKNGFGWQLGDVIAARVVYVPAGKVSGTAQKSAMFVSGLFVVLFGSVVGAINLMLRRGVLSPLKSLTAASHAISKAPAEDSAVVDFAKTEAGQSLAETRGRGDELGDLADGFLTMAGDVHKREIGLRQARAQAQQREAYFRALIENASVTYVILDTRYMIRYASPLVKKVLGADPQELTGKLFLHLVPDDNQRPLFEAVERAESQKGTSDPFVFKRVMPGTHETRYIEAVVTNLIDQPSIKGLVIVLRDVSERHQLEELKQGTQIGMEPARGVSPASLPLPPAAASPPINARPEPTPVTVSLAPLPEPVKAVVETPADPLTMVQKLVETFPGLEAMQQQAIILRLVAAGMATGAKASLPVNGVAILRTKLQLPETQAVDAGRLVELFVLLAEYAVALDTLVWSTWKQLAPSSEIRRTGTGSSAVFGQMGMKKLFGAYIDTESTIPKGQVAYDLERSRALTAALIASIGQVGQEFAQRYRAKFEPRAIEQRAGVVGGGGLLGSKDAKCWRAYRELANEMDAAKIEGEVLQGLAHYAESLMKSLR